MKLRTIGGVHFADYCDGTAAVRCDDLSEMWGRALEKRAVDETLGRRVSSHTEARGNLLPRGKKRVVINIEN